MSSDLLNKPLNRGSDLSLSLAQKPATFGAVTRIIDNCLGPSKYPASEVEIGALGPRVHRAAKQMESMGLWRPSLDPYTE